MPVDSIMPAGEGDLLAVEETLDDGNRLREPLDPGASGVETQPGFVVLRFHVPSAQADLKPAIGQEVGRRRLTRHRKSLLRTLVPTRSRFVAAAALISAGMGAKIPARWSGTVKTEYPNSSTFRALSAHSARDPALHTFTPKRKGFIIYARARAERKDQRR